MLFALLNSPLEHLLETLQEEVVEEQLLQIFRQIEKLIHFYSEDLLDAVRIILDLRVFMRIYHWNYIVVKLTSDKLEFSIFKTNFNQS